MRSQWGREWGLSPSASPLRRDRPHGSDEPIFGAPGAVAPLPPFPQPGKAKIALIRAPQECEVKPSFLICCTSSCPQMRQCLLLPEATAAHRVPGSSPAPGRTKTHPGAAPALSVQQRRVSAHLMQGHLCYWDIIGFIFTAPNPVRDNNSAFHKTFYSL